MPLCDCLDKTLELVRVEIRLLLLALRYPQAFEMPAMHSSHLYWSESFTQTDLMELIAGLHGLQVLRTRDGKPAPLNLITEDICLCFHTNVTRPTVGNGPL